MEAARFPWPALGVLLVRDGLVSSEDLERVLELQGDDRGRRLSSRRLGEALVHEGLVTAEQVARLVAEQHELPFVDLDSPDAMVPVGGRIPEEIARGYAALPIREFPDGSLVVVIADPTRLGCFDEIRRAAGVPVRFAVAAPDAIQLAIDATAARGLFDAQDVPAAEDVAAARSGPDVPFELAADAPPISPETTVAGGERLWPVFGSLLLRDGLVTESELETALAQQRLSSTSRLGEILVARGSLTDEQVTRVLAEQHELPFLDLRAHEIDVPVAERLPTDLARRHAAIPVACLPDGSLLVAVADPTSAVSSEELRVALESPLRFAVATPAAIHEAVEYVAGRPKEPGPDGSVLAPEAPPLILVPRAEDTNGEQAAHADENVGPALYLEIDADAHDEPTAQGTDEEPDGEIAVDEIEPAFEANLELMPENVDVVAPQPIETAAEPAAEEDPEPEVGPEDAIAAAEVEQTFEADAEATSPWDVEFAVAAEALPHDDDEPAAVDEVEQTFQADAEAMSPWDVEFAVAAEALPAADGDIAAQELGPAFEADAESASDGDDEVAVAQAIGTASEPAVEDAYEAAEESPEPDGEPNRVPVSPVVEALGSALARGASAVHFTPGEDGIVVRARIGEQLIVSETIPPDDVVAVMGDLHELSSNGWVSLTDGNGTAELRPVVLPTVRGLRATFRLLEEATAEPSFEELLAGVTPRLTADVLSAPGMFVVGGPLGSGRTTTLYTALQELADDAVLTIEDPVERIVRGVDQTQVSPRTGLTFAAGLEALLRSDPDAVAVGDLLDPETARLAIRAALAGRRVLTTVEAHGAAGTVRRLLDLGIEPDALAAALSGIVGQRLVRRICRECREAYYATAEELVELGLGEEEGGRRLLGRGSGCVTCHGTGHDGNVAVFEVFPLTDGVRALVAAGAPAAEIEEAAVAAGMRTLRESAVQLCLEGVTSATEARRVPAAATS